MSTNSSVDLAAQPGKAQLRKSLKLWQVVVMGLAYLTPMTVFDTFGIVSGISNGHVPASYLLALAGCLPPSVTESWYASFHKPVRPTPMRKKQSTRMWGLWSAGRHCLITCSCR